MRKIKWNTRKSRRFIVIISAAVLLILLACLADQICPFDPNEQNLSNALQSPSFVHLMGTDQYGRDLFSRILAGGKASILSALTYAFLSSFIGIILGLLCGTCGSAFDTVIMRLCDIFLSFPAMAAAMAMAALLHNGIKGAVFALILVSWPKYARLARNETLSVRESTWIKASVLAGDRTIQLICRHILPDIAAPLITAAVSDVGTGIMEIAGLSFLGLGAQPPAAEWGSMMSSSRSMLQTYPWIVLAPGLAIFITTAVFNLLGDAMRDLLDAHESEVQADE